MFKKAYWFIIISFNLHSASILKSDLSKFFLNPPLNSSQPKNPHLYCKYSLTGDIFYSRRFFISITWTLPSFAKHQHVHSVQFTIVAVVSELPEVFNLLGFDFFYVFAIRGLFLQRKDRPIVIWILFHCFGTSRVK